MRIRAIRMADRAPDAPLQADFPPAGGTIGRGSDCTLVLPDPYRHVSRIHAEVAQVDGRWLLTNRGSANPVIRNGEEIPRNRQVVLADGDVLVIGEYELQVDMHAAAAPAPPEAASAAQMPPTQFWNSILSDPAGDSSLGHWLGDDKTNKASDQASVLPDDHPFAPDPQTQFRPPGGWGSPDAIAGNAQAGSPMSPAELDLGAKQGDDLNAMFGLGKDEPLNFETPPEQELPGTGGRSGARDDPFEALGFERPAPVPDAAVPDHAPSWHESFPLPRPATPAAPPTPPSSPVPSPAQRIRTDNSAGASSSAARAGEASRAAPASPPGKPAPPPAAVPHDRLRSIVDEAINAHAESFAPLQPTHSGELIDEINSKSAAAAAQWSAERSAAPPDELLRHLLAGLELPGLPRPLGDANRAAGLTPELMRQIGELLRVSVQGVLALLAARATIKQEMRADVTVIAERANNPLKFSPNALSAMTHLLSPQPIRGFMPPAEAMRDAYDDLVAHQVAYVVATRAAMQQLLDRFDPAKLEARLSHNRRLLDSVLPGARKARLWELFSELFGELSREAEDDFESLFGKAFRQTYEAQIERLREHDEGGA